MSFEFVRGYVQLASGLTDVTRARAMEAAQGLLSLPAAGIATGGKMAVQVGALADELLTTAAANRSNLTTLVRSEVDVAITRLGLVSVQQLEEAQAEAARLRAEVARLRWSAPRAAAAPTSTAKRASATRTTAKKAAKTAKSAAVSKADTASPAGQSAVTTRIKPVDA